MLTALVLYPGDRVALKGRNLDISTSFSFDWNKTQDATVDQVNDFSY